MTKQFIRTTVIWGSLLWLFGYILGIFLFPFVPSLLGWIIMPIGTLATVWVLRKKVIGHSVLDYLSIAVIWLLIAVIGDYLFLVKIFQPADGYYKLDVYLYYGLTFLLPLIVGLFPCFTRKHLSPHTSIE